MVLLQKTGNIILLSLLVDIIVSDTVGTFPQLLLEMLYGLKVILPNLYSWLNICNRKFEPVYPGILCAFDFYSVVFKT